ncbi:prepilin peptidase [Pseudoalteromonas fenneropenaei]|uniref:Prepilin leader peptidase/N-methyltransferase n=1 Tax=Pseudoalteromonas fenneropenaei TaxID=1737459 RepID=A0ABV7CL68_9GAMM
MLELFSQTLALLQSNLAFYLLTVALTTLCIGSFLNVVIYRLPKMMQNEWQNECRTLLADELKTNTVGNQPVFNLVLPHSHCPSCQTPIKIWQNIPLLSWLLLKGQCGQCHSKISSRYPIIEMLTALLSVVVAWQLGASTLALTYIVVTCALIALTFIDIDHMLLPDQITLPLLWFALLAAAFGITIPPAEAILGAAIGYMSLWCVFWAFKLLTGKEGMGYGDFKLLAVFGALLGWQALLLIILLSSLVGAIIGSIQLSIQGKDKATPIPFGPYIAIAGWIAMLWGDALQTWYFGLLS